MNKYMEEAINCAYNGIRNREGGPFGCVIVDEDGNIVGKGNNKVLLNNDPTAHGEITAIRDACNKLNTYDLSGYSLYTSAEPCPMCLSAIIWANIKKVYYGCSAKDAANIGFRDDDIYEHIKGNNKMIELKQINREEAIKVFEEYNNNNGTIY